MKFDYTRKLQLKGKSMQRLYRYFIEEFRNAMGTGNHFDQNDVDQYFAMI